MGMKAVELFHLVPQPLVVEATQVCVLNACSHAGLVAQARSIFTSIENKTEKHYAAMVIVKWPILLDSSKGDCCVCFYLKIDCLNRGALFDEAQRLIDQYELHHPPSPVMYSEYHKGVGEGEKTVASNSSIHHRNEIMKWMNCSCCSVIIISCKKSEKQRVSRKHLSTNERAFLSPTRSTHLSHSFTCQSLWIFWWCGQSVGYSIRNEWIWCQKKARSQLDCN